MATLVRQDPQLKRAFYRQIEEEARQRRADAVDTMRAAHPVLGAVLDPVIRFTLWNDDLNNDAKGIDGETAVSRALRRLPASWFYLNNVVLVGEADDYAQLDHVAVGPSGVYAVETKHWSGALHGSRDVWRMKQHGGRWKKVGSPSAQSNWHARRIRDLLGAYGVETPVIPVVVFVHSDWVRWDDCTGLIFDGVGKMRQALARSKGDAIPTQDERRLVADRIALGTVPAAPADPPRAADTRTDAPLPPVSPDPPARPQARPLPHGADHPASPKQRDYVRRLLTGAGVAFTEPRIEQMTAGEAQAVIDRLRFHRAVDLPPLD